MKNTKAFKDISSTKEGYQMSFEITTLQVEFFNILFLQTYANKHFFGPKFFDILEKEVSKTKTKTKQKHEHKSRRNIEGDQQNENCIFQRVI